MELNTALQKLKEYEKRSFALYHASGLIYYDGATTAPKGSAGVRAITLGELSRISCDEFIFVLTKQIEKHSVSSIMMFRFPVSGPIASSSFIVTCSPPLNSFFLL